MNPSPLNLRRLFSLEDEDVASESRPDWRMFRERLAAETKTIQWPAMPDLAAKVGELFDLELPELFVRAWKKSAEISQALEESKQTPDDPRSVALAEHVWQGALHPFIDVHIKGVRVKRLQFALEISATLQGIELWIKNGAIEKIATGNCKFSGRIKYEDLLLAEKETASLPLRDILLCERAADPESKRGLTTA